MVSNSSIESKTGSLSSCRSRLYANGNPLRVTSKVVRFPMKRPALPLANSAISGFFFCGMMDEPVEKASSKVTQPNSWVFQIVNSSPIRERWIPNMAKIKSASATKSLSLTASMLFLVTPAKARSAAIISGFGTSEEPASAPDPSGEIEFLESQSFIRSTSRNSA